MDKKSQRQLTLMKRHELPALLKAQYDENIRTQLLKLTGRYEHIGIYVSKDDETDTRRLIQLLLSQGKRVSVPRCSATEQRPTLEFYQILSLEECLPSRFGLLEPVPQPCRLTNPADIELMIVPLVAFDEKHNRIGYGRGYYDSVLAEFAGLKVGLGYELQKIDEFEPEAHDVPLDVIITEREVL